MGSKHGTSLWAKRGSKTDWRTMLLERQREIGQLNRRIRRITYMNNDEFEGKWKQMRGQVKVWWGTLGASPTTTWSGSAASSTN